MNLPLSLPIKPANPGPSEETERRHLDTKWSLNPLPTRHARHAGVSAERGRAPVQRITYRTIRPRLLPEGKSRDRLENDAEHAGVAASPGCTNARRDTAAGVGPLLDFFVVRGGAGESGDRPPEDRVPEDRDEAFLAVRVEPA